MTSRAFLAGCALLLLVGCAGPDPNLTDTGAGKPKLTVDFPQSAAPGDVVTASVEVTNPGPRDMDSIVVSFVRVGDPSLPEPIVEPRKGRVQSGIEDIRPEPRGQSPADAHLCLRGDRRRRIADARVRSAHAGGERVVRELGAGVRRLRGRARGGDQAGDRGPLSPLVRSISTNFSPSDRRTRSVLRFGSLPVSSFTLLRR